MLWGAPFQAVHLATLAVAVALIVGFYFLLKYLPDRVRYICILVMSCSGIVAIIYNLVAWGSPLEYLPFHMCSIAAILLPVAVITRNRYVGNLLLVWCLGSILALVFTDAQANYVIPSPAFFIYYIPHVFEFAVAIYLFAFGYIKKDYKCIPVTVGLTVAIYTIVHLINLALNHYCAVNHIVDYAGEVLTFNYMFSMEPTTSIFYLFWNIIPHPYWYMYVAVVILVAYLVVLYLPQIFQAVKERKQK
ncbi:MAG: YwaF family protein [Clostridia bacterium]|nr:YwaF family protein [Clostridia bacterium]